MNLPGLDVVSPVSGASVVFRVSSVEVPAFEDRFGTETWKPSSRNKYQMVLDKIQDLIFDLIMDLIIKLIQAILERL